MPQQPRMRYGRLAPDGTVIEDRPPIDPDNPTEEELRILSYPSILLSFEAENVTTPAKVYSNNPPEK